MTAPPPEPAAYFIIRSQIADAERYERFRTVIVALAEQFEARYLFRSDQVEVVHGSYPGGLFVCFEFPSMHRLRRFLESSEFADLSQEMYEAGTQDAWVVPGV